MPKTTFMKQGTLLEIFANQQIYKWEQMRKLLDCDQTTGETMRLILIDDNSKFSRHGADIPDITTYVAKLLTRVYNI